MQNTTTTEQKRITPTHTNDARPFPFLKERILKKVCNYYIFNTEYTTFNDFKKHYSTLSNLNRFILACGKIERLLTPRDYCTICGGFLKDNEINNHEEKNDYNELKVIFNLCFNCTKTRGYMEHTERFLISMNNLYKVNDYNYIDLEIYNMYTINRLKYGLRVHRDNKGLDYIMDKEDTLKLFNCDLIYYIYDYKTKETKICKMVDIKKGGKDIKNYDADLMNIWEDDYAYKYYFREYKNEPVIIYDNDEKEDILYYKIDLNNYEDNKTYRRAPFKFMCSMYGEHPHNIIYHNTDKRDYGEYADYTNNILYNTRAHRDRQHIKVSVNKINYLYATSDIDDIRKLKNHLLD